MNLRDLQKWPVLFSWSHNSLNEVSKATVLHMEVLDASTQRNRLVSVAYARPVLLYFSCTMPVKPKGR